MRSNLERQTRAVRCGAICPCIYPKVENMSGGSGGIREPERNGGRLRPYERMEKWVERETSGGRETHVSGE